MATPTKAEQEAAEKAQAEAQAQAEAEAQAATKRQAEATPKAPSGQKVLTPAPVRYTERNGVRTAEIDA